MSFRKQKNFNNCYLHIDLQLRSRRICKSKLIDEAHSIRVLKVLFILHGTSYENKLFYSFDFDKLL